MGHHPRIRVSDGRAALIADDNGCAAQEIRAGDDSAGQPDRRADADLDLRPTGQADYDWRRADEYDMRGHSSGLRRQRRPGRAGREWHPEWSQHAAMAAAVHVHDSADGWFAD